MPIDPNTLLEEAKCFVCLNVSLEEAIELALLMRQLLKAPTLTMDLASTTGSVHITWTDSVPGSLYEVWKRTESGSYSLVTTTAGLSYTDTAGIANHDVWYFKVRVVGSSLFSNEVAISNNLQFLASAVTTISYPSLILDVGANGVAVATNSVTSVSFPLLVQCSGAFVVQACVALTTISLPSLTTCVKGVAFTGNTLLSTLDIHSLVAPGALAAATYSLQINGNPALQHPLINPSLIFSEVTLDDYHFDGNALDVATEKVILQCMINSLIANMNQVDMDGGSNAPPDAAMNVLITTLSNAPYNTSVLTN